MSWPQVLVLSIYGISLGYELANHGKEREGKHQFGYAVIANAIMLSLLYWGGFFS